MSGSDDPIYYKPFEIYWKPVILTGYASLAFLPMWFVEEYYGWGAIGSLLWKCLSVYMGYRADYEDSFSAIDPYTAKKNMILHGVGGGIDLIVAYHAFTYDWCNNGLSSKCKKAKEEEFEEEPMSEDDYYYRE